MSLNFGYSPNYYSLEDILATQERVPCKFLQNVPRMGKSKTHYLFNDISINNLLLVCVPILPGFTNYY